MNSPTRNNTNNKRFENKDFSGCFWVGKNILASPSSINNQPNIVMISVQSIDQWSCIRMTINPPINKTRPLRYTTVGWTFFQILKFKYSDEAMAISIGPITAARFRETSIFKISRPFWTCDLFQGNLSKSGLWNPNNSWSKNTCKGRLYCTQISSKSDYLGCIDGLFFNPETFHLGKQGFVLHIQNYGRALRTAHTALGML